MSSATTAAEEGEGAPEESQGMAQLEFSAEGVPALVDGGVVLDNPALMEFFARAVASYSIPGQDGIQSGTLVQINSNTILAVASVDGGGPTEAEIIEAASTVMLPSVEEQTAIDAGPADDVPADPSQQPETTIDAGPPDDVPADADTDCVEGTVPSEQTAAPVATPDDIHIAPSMTEMDFSNLLSGSEEAGSGEPSTVVVRSLEPSQPPEQMEHRVIHVTLTAEDVGGRPHVAVAREDEPSVEPVQNVDHDVTDVIQRALLGGDEDEDVGPSIAGNPVEGVHRGSGSEIDGTDAGCSADASLLEEAAADPDERRRLEEESQSGNGVGQELPPPGQGGQDVVVIDVTNPIQLSQNSLIVVNGQKCVLQQDPSTGQVVAYPIREPEKPKKRRGRPRKVVQDPPAEPEPAPAPAVEEPEEVEEEEEQSLNKLGVGTVEIVTEDGALVRRSCRQRRKAKSMKDYETNLKLQDESDEEAPEEEEEEPEEVLPDIPPWKKARGRPPKKQQASDSLDPFWKNTGGAGTPRRKRGRPRRQQPPQPRKPPMQAFLVQMADGQTLMMQIPAASIPPGMDLHDVAQNIANSLNAAAQQQGSMVLQQQGLSTTPNGDLMVTQTLTGPTSEAQAGAPSDAGDASQITEHQASSGLDAAGPVSLAPATTLPSQLAQLDSILPPQSVILAMDGVADGLLLGSTTLLTSPLAAAAAAAPTPVKRRPGRPRKRPPTPPPPPPLPPSPPAAEEPSAAGDPRETSGFVRSDGSEEAGEDPGIPRLLESESAAVAEVDSTAEESPAIASSLADAVAQVLASDNENNMAENVPAKQDAPTNEGGEIPQQPPLAGAAAEAQVVPEPQDVAAPAVPSALPGASATVIPVPEKLVPILMPMPRVGLKSTDADLERLQCQVCEFQAYYPKQFQEHILTHEDSVLKCKCCPFACFDENELIAHYKDQHPRCICPYCNHTAEHSYIVKRHMFRHTECGCKCDICGKIYKDQYILKMHVKMVHMPVEVLFECSVCLKKFNRKAHLKRHVRTHNPTKPFKCQLCDYRGCERSDITKHMLIHEEPKHTCDICGRCFRHIKNKELHLKRHKGQKDYKCGVCEFYGYTFTDIRKHIERKHSDPRTILCDRCGQAFKTQALLKEHKMSVQCEVYMIEQELTEYDPAVTQMTDSAEDCAGEAQEDMVTEEHQQLQANHGEELATLELTDESLATLSSLANGQQIFVRKVDGADGQYAILTTADGEGQEITYISEDGLAVQLGQAAVGNSEAGEEEIPAAVEESRQAADDSKDQDSAPVKTESADVLDA
ncbi:hypothetical protein HPB47_012596 [Ixodes persulcatus]|uniref:Uncharacterized protein n=1 Tax=Ixodes persulcatus TaxID=34615 RepID=A0AC60NT76_IXOPE|nr:hypothetical protein HPB47_012596 [Ixodes persulcatus]